MINLSFHFNALEPNAIRIPPFTIVIILILEKFDLTDFAVGCFNHFKTDLKMKPPRFRICGPRGASFLSYTKP